MAGGEGIIIRLIRPAGRNQALHQQAGAAGHNRRQARFDHAVLQVVLRRHAGQPEAEVHDHRQHGDVLQHDIGTLQNALVLTLVGKFLIHRHVDRLVPREVDAQAGGEQQSWRDQLRGAEDRRIPLAHGLRLAGPGAGQQRQ